MAISLACLLVLNLTGGVVLAGGGIWRGEFYEMHVNLNGETLAVANYYNDMDLIFNMHLLCVRWGMRLLMTEKQIVLSQIMETLGL